MGGRLGKIKVLNFVCGVENSKYDFQDGCKNKKTGQ